MIGTNNTGWDEDGVTPHPTGGYVRVYRTTDVVIYLDTSVRRHRLDGPAVERAEGAREWWINGKRHRLDGPAVEWPDGIHGWWVHGFHVTEAEHAEIVARLRETGEAPDK